MKESLETIRLKIRTEESRSPDEHESQIFPSCDSPEEFDSSTLPLHWGTVFTAEDLFNESNLLGIPITGVIVAREKERRFRVLHVADSFRSRLPAWADIDFQSKWVVDPHVEKEVEALAKITINAAMRHLHIVYGRTLLPEEASAVNEYVEKVREMCETTSRTMSNSMRHPWRQRFLSAIDFETGRSIETELRSEAEMGL